MTNPSVGDLADTLVELAGTTVGRGALGAPALRMRARSTFTAADGSASTVAVRTIG